jgi:putative hemolysin
MAKLNRERRLQERRAAKQVRKDARKRAALESDGPADTVADHLTIVNQLAGADGLARADRLGDH